MIEILKCPVCNEPLSLGNKVYSCKNHHSFDLAKEGYLNLILNAKKTAGDSKAMMSARRDFLAKSYYEELSNVVNHYLQTALVTDKAVIDIGCGEGYYLSRFQEKFASSHEKLYGLDISKTGIKMAAKKNSNIHWLVANFSKLPFTDHSVSTVLSMFAEYSVTEIDRVLTDSGTVIIVRAANNHLMELKSIIYPEIHEKTKIAAIKDFPHFEVERHLYQYQVQIHRSDDLMQLLLMTPHYWKIKPEGIENLKNYDQLTVTVSVEIDVLKRK